MMLFSLEKYSREITLLRELPENDDLHPLKKEQIKQILLKRISAEPSIQPESHAWLERKNKIIRYVVSTLVGLSLVGGTALASNGANPGDILYPVKQAREKIQLNLAFSEEAKAKLETKFAEERINELNTIQTLAPNKNNKQPKTKAEIRAETEVNQAITNLHKVQTNLEGKGNVNAAASVRQAIIRLQNKIETSNEARLKIDKRQKPENPGPGLTETSDSDKIELKLPNNKVDYNGRGEINTPKNKGLELNNKLETKTN